MLLVVASSVLRRLPVLGILLLMLVPTGMCLCAGHEEGDPFEHHEPGCPKVRKLERPSPPAQYAADDAVVTILTEINDSCPQCPFDPVAAVAHGPPVGQPIYLTHQTLLI
jgi:hypothetical protein